MSEKKTLVEFREDAKLSKAVQDIIANTNNPALNQIKDRDIKITSVIKSRTKDGESEQNPGQPAKIQKVSGLWKLFTDAQYILVVDEYFFNTANCTEAVIFNALCEIEVKAKDGEIVLATKKPDIQVFKATLEVFGAFDDLLLGMREWMNNAKTKAAKSFVEKISTGKLDKTEPKTEPEPAPSEEERPHIQAGMPEEEEAPKRKRGGRTIR